MLETSINSLQSPGTVIIGAGHAGGSVAAFLRQNGFAGSITLIGEEPLEPYQRPPLSKAWLKGEANEEGLRLRPAEFYLENCIQLYLNTRVDAIDRSARLVCMADGKTVNYDNLILATGARARTAPFEGTSLPVVLELRTATDAEKLKLALKQGARVVIVGGGYVGLEVAASARALGAEVVVVEREARPLARVACSQLSSFFLRYHSQRGVTFRLGRSVQSVQMLDGAARVCLDDGEQLPADLVLVGVGAVPNEELARHAGLPCDDGVLVDLTARTDDPNIYAIGDCTRRPLPLYNRKVRLESVPNALEQAKQAAASICNLPAPRPETPWFWSDQFDVKLQIAGLPMDVAEIVIRGDPNEDRFAVFHVSADRRIQAVEAVNAVPEFMMGRQLIGARTEIDVERLRNPSISMKEVAI
ncbi:3-phenylpropionate/trans-cinnamate dioxygenase ferredoxin reductase subunit [Burkholderia sp. OK233]|nr:3-phenylpropionate/trans-cinnamate dioxygenase ferredoxin reductase subunit [Burkholderia sp. OK233]